MLEIKKKRNQIPNHLDFYKGITMNEIRPMYDYKKIAGILGVSHNTVRDWRNKGLMPKPDIQKHRWTRWKADTIEPFLVDPVGWREENLN